MAMKCDVCRPGVSSAASHFRHHKRRELSVSVPTGRKLVRGEQPDVLDQEALTVGATLKTRKGQGSVLIVIAAMQMGLQPLEVGPRDPKLNALHGVVQNQCRTCARLLAAVSTAGCHRVDLSEICTTWRPRQSTCCSAVGHTLPSTRWSSGTV